VGRGAIALGVLVSAVVLPRYPVAAPEQAALATATLPVVGNMAELLRLRDRLYRDLNRPDTVMVATRSGVEVVPATTLAQFQAVDHRLRQEELALGLGNQARQAAATAIALGPPEQLSPSALAAAYGHWQDALALLGRVPGETFAAAQLAPQRQEYERQLAMAAYHYDTARSAFLHPLVEATGQAEGVRLTVCSLDRECRRWQGNRPPASPASLIKVPVAIALVSHLQQRAVDPSVAIRVDPGNWTEDAGSTWVGTDYPLEQLMADMLSASGNIATNQLIDYLGWQGVNQPLRARGYGATRVSRKLVGQSTYPAQSGSAPNTLTTDELTDMMVAVYRDEVPHADLIRAALANQRDRALGHAAVPPSVVWLGEKTGRNSKVLGTTTAVQVDGQGYILTATLDYSANEAAMGSLLAGVLQHLLRHRGFGPQGELPGAIAPRSQTFLPQP
jgi:beta-lactamase class A